MLRENSSPHSGKSNPSMADSIVTFGVQSEMGQSSATSDSKIRDVSKERKSLKRRPKHKKSYVYSFAPGPFKRKIKRSGSSLANFQAELTTLFLRKLKRKLRHLGPQEDGAKEKKTIEELIETLSTVGFMDPLYSVHSESSEHDSEDSLYQKERFLRAFAFLPNFSDFVMRYKGSLRERKDQDRNAINIIDTLFSSSSTSAVSASLSEEEISSILDDSVLISDSSSIRTLDDGSGSLEQETLETDEDDNSLTETDTLQTLHSTESLSLVPLVPSSSDSFDRFLRESVIKKRKRELDEEIMEEMMRMNASTCISEECPITNSAISNIVQQFLEQLITKTVHHSESNKSTKLNKPLILSDMMEAIEEYRTELKLQETLNLCMVEYFIRKRRFNAIMPTKSEEIYKSRLSTALGQLDHLTNVQDVTFDFCLAEMEHLKAEEAVMRTQTQNQIMQLESTVRKSIANRPYNEKLVTFVNDNLKRMAKLRDEVSKTRLQSIFKQHAVKEIKEKIKKIEHISDDLSMSTYIATNEQVKTLLKKIGERNTELKRFSIKCKSMLHMLAHYKTKRVMLNENLRSLRKKVAIQSEAKRDLRKRVFDLTRDHNSLRQQIEDIKSNGTIQQYPLLCSDYSKTVDSNREKRSRVEDLRIQHDYLAWRLDNLEKRLQREQELKNPNPSAQRVRKSIRPKYASALTWDISKAIERAIKYHGPDDHKFKEFVLSLGIDPTDYETESNDVSSSSSSAQVTEPF